MNYLKNFIFILIITIFIINCNNQTQETTTTSTTTTIKKATIIGYWKSSYGDGFEIKDETPKMFYQYDDPKKTISFAGEIVNNADFSNDTGFITVKITNSGSWGKTAGEYLVVRWKNFSGNICKQSTPYKQGGASTKPTKEEAENEFTEANGYYTLYGEYTKQ